MYPFGGSSSPSPELEPLVWTSPSPGTMINRLRYPDGSTYGVFSPLPNPPPLPLSNDTSTADTVKITMKYV